MINIREEPPTPVPPLMGEAPFSNAHKQGRNQNGEGGEKNLAAGDLGREHAEKWEEGKGGAELSQKMLIPPSPQKNPLLTCFVLICLF